MIIEDRHACVDKYTLVNQSHVYEMKRSKHWVDSFLPVRACMYNHERDNVARNVQEIGCAGVVLVAYSADSQRGLYALSPGSIR